MHRNAWESLVCLLSLESVDWRAFLACAMRDRRLTRVGYFESLDRTVPETPMQQLLSGQRISIDVGFRQHSALLLEGWPEIHRKILPKNRHSESSSSSANVMSLRFALVHQILRERGNKKLLFSSRRSQESFEPESRVLSSSPCVEAPKSLPPSTAVPNLLQAPSLKYTVCTPDILLSYLSSSPH